MSLLRATLPDYPPEPPPWVLLLLLFVLALLAVWPGAGHGP